MKNRFNCLFKKVKDDMLQRIQEASMSDALEKIENSGSYGLVDEEEVLEILI